MLAVKCVFRVGVGLKKGKTERGNKAGCKERVMLHAS